jgi:phosphohistidine swiveling domain-containing protein
MKLDLLSSEQLIDQINEIIPLLKTTAYINIVAPLLMAVYNRILMTALKKNGIENKQFDPASSLQEIRNYDPNYHLFELHREYKHLAEEVQLSIQTLNYERFRKLAGVDAFKSSVENFIEEHGHLSENGNDFSYAPWRENPDFVLDLIIHFDPGQYKTEGNISFDRLPLSSIQRFLLRPVYLRARKYRLYREQISSAYTLGYGLLRNFYLALGRIFATDNILETPADIFYLYDPEVRCLVSEQDSNVNLKEFVVQRKKEMDEYKSIVLPTIIYGETAPPIIMSYQEKLHGMPTSGGIYTGRARKIFHLNDMSKLKQGDVLIIPYSDVSWTPLFGRAGAVIAESGGILSHSSIIAREYQIPAVVSVDGASQIDDDAVVTVDGYTGEVILNSSLV